MSMALMSIEKYNFKLFDLLNIFIVDIKNLVCISIFNNSLYSLKYFDNLIVQKYGLNSLNFSKINSFICLSYVILSGGPDM